MGRRLERIEVRHRGVVRGRIERASGYTVSRVRRWGKHIVIDLARRTDTACLVVHLGMTGQFRLDSDPGAHTHALFHLDGGLALVYNDIRRFGRLEFAPRLPERLARLGPDPLELGEDDFAARLRARRAMVKPLLLDQRFLRGLGNIYADEALFRARIHPRAIASRLGPARARTLHRAIVEVLTDAIRHGGSSVSNYVASDGRAGGFQLRHQVYRRTGRPCHACGAAIRRIVLASRGTHFCPKCQRSVEKRPIVLS